MIKKNETQKVARTFKLSNEVCEGLRKYAYWERVGQGEAVEMALKTMLNNWHPKEEKTPPKDLLDSLAKVKETSRQKIVRFNSQEEVYAQLNKEKYKHSRNSAALARKMVEDKCDYDSIYNYCKDNLWLSTIAASAKQISSKKADSFVNLKCSETGEILNEARLKKWPLVTINAFANDIAKKPKAKSPDMREIVSVMRAYKQGNIWQDKEEQANVIRYAFNVFTGKTKMRNGFDIEKIPQQIEIIENDGLQGKLFD